MPRTTVADVLSCLDDEFAEFAGGFARGEYLLWLGSGISRDVVPSVPALLRGMLEFLRARVDPADPDCRFRAALEEVLDVGGVSEAVRSGLTLGEEVDTWDGVDDIVNRLVDRYSDVLNVRVRGEAEDYLVWTGLDAAATYGDSRLEPDAEHLCVAILMLEGVVRSAPTTNWDGLVEAAMKKLVGDTGQFLRVVVVPADFREPELQAELLKFHGCAVRAAADEGEYRSRLIARKTQISGWATKPENQLMKSRLEHLFATRSALIVGLSAQDANIHTVLHQASQNLIRAWPASPPPVVFAEQGLHYHHKHVLQVTYGDTYSANEDAIAKSALLGAFAKPTLVGLVLFTLADKLCTLAGHVPELSLTGAELERVRKDLCDLRDVVGSSAESDPRGLIEAMVPLMAQVLMSLRFGRTPNPSSVQYQPLSIAPILQAVGNPDFPAASLGRLAVVISLLARGLSAGRWSLGLGSPSAPGGGVVRLARGSRTTRVFVVGGPRSLSQLEADGVVDPDDDDVLIVQTESVQSRSSRSPRAHYGRTGAKGARQVDLEDLCSTANSADDLYESFRLEGVL
jgi:hypothetical protein